jgi:hypothetical protein
VAQEFFNGIYGKSISFQAIDSISDEAYFESPTFFNYPPLPSTLNRCHSFTQIENNVAIDAKFITTDG